MAISSGDMVLIAESDRFINASNQLATQLFDSVSDQIFDFETMKQAIKEAYSGDPSLANLIADGNISDKGWFALFEHPKVQAVIRKNSKEVEDPAFMEKLTKRSVKAKTKITRINQRNREILKNFTKAKKRSAFLDQWSNQEELFLKKNKDQALGVLFINYKKKFKKERSISSIKNKLRRLEE